jgi:hypothetical protein
MEKIMTRRVMLATALVLCSVGGARAAQINLPSALPPLEVPGNFAILGNLRFSNFTYVTAPLGSPPPDSAVTVSNFTSVPGEPGITFSGAFAAAATQTVDYKLSFMVTTTDGTQLTDAYLALGGFVNFGGTGSVSIGETITNLSGTVISKVPFQISTPNQTSDTTSLLPPASTILVTKDILITGGSNGAAFSFVNQGFSSAAVPEPASLVLVGIGVGGLFSIRRFLRRAGA